MAPSAPLPYSKTPNPTDLDCEDFIGMQFLMLSTFLADRFEILQSHERRRFFVTVFASFDVTSLFTPSAP